MSKTKELTITRVAVYLFGGDWCYAAYAEDGFDCSDTLGIDSSATWSEAINEASDQFPGAVVAAAGLDSEVARG